MKLDKGRLRNIWCNVIVSVKNIYRWRRMSRVWIGDAGAEEMLDRVVCCCEQFSFQMCLESGDGSRTFCNWRQRVPGQLVLWYSMPWIESWPLSPADGVVVDWRISECELVDDDETSHVDKPIVLFSEFYV